MYKAIIIEDEALARQRLRYLLEAHHNTISIIGESDTGKAGIDMANQTRPDVIFLDVHLPDMYGFDVLKALDIQPMIIFTTAYSDYAVQAFDVFSIDYLVKPFDAIRFQKTIDKISKFQQLYPIPDYERLATLFFESQRKPKQTTLAVRSGQKFLLIDFEDITHLKADDKYVTVTTSNSKSYLCDKSLGTLEDVLPDDFIRIHRSIIINKTWVAEIHRYFKGRLMLVLDDKDRTSVVTSDSYTQAVREKLNL
jgi:two-component system LytT family response regulator